MTMTTIVFRPLVGALLLVAAAGVPLAGAQDAPRDSDARNESADGWTELIVGESLDGWVQRGGKAKYEVRGDAIVGSSRPGTPNSFLCTERDYGDFVLELEFKVDPRLNSGVQIRSQVFDEATKVTWETEDGETEEKLIPAGRVHGYQVEIDPSPRAWSGGIYDEGRRGWLNPLDDRPEAREAFKQGQWNAFRVECRGPRIRTWINDVAAADLTDDLTLEGFIALQVHSTRESEPMEVMWRKIRIKELDGAEDASADEAPAEDE